MLSATGESTDGEPLAILSCMHPVDDGRVAYRIAKGLRDASLSVTWVGPNRSLTGGQVDGIGYQLYSPGRGRLGRLTHARQTYKAAKRIPQPFVAYAPEPDSAIVSLLLRRAGYADYVIFDIHEVYHDQQARRWTPFGLRRVSGLALLQLIRYLVRASDLVIGVSETVLEPVATSACPYLIVRNSPTTQFGMACHDDRSNEGTVRVMHGKTAGHHGTMSVLNAIALTQARLPDLRVVMFDYFGSNASEFSRQDFDRLVAQHSLGTSVELLTMVPYDQMPDIVGACDIGLIAYEPRWASVSLPNRLFEYMAAGIPVIAPRYAPAISKIIREANCGLLVDTQDPSAIAEAIIFLAENRDRADELGALGRAAFERTYSWEAQFEPVLERIRQHNSSRNRTRFEE